MENSLYTGVGEVYCVMGTICWRIPHCSLVARILNDCVQDTEQLVSYPDPL